jgi:hypothetical protein
MAITAAVVTLIVVKNEPHHDANYSSKMVGTVPVHIDQLLSNHQDPQDKLDILALEGCHFDMMVSAQMLQTHRNISVHESPAMRNSNALNERFNAIAKKAGIKGDALSTREDKFCKKYHAMG